MGVTYSIYQNDAYIKFDKDIILDLYKNNKLLNNNSEEYIDYNLGVYNELINSQVKIATDWCKKYGVKINEDSIYYKKNN